MTITERFRELGLPVDQVVIIGSGIMDALGIRTSRDIDLVVSQSLFSQLEASADWRASERHGEVVLERDDAEAWLSWGSEGQPNFDELYQSGTTVDGIRLASLDFVLSWKRDQADPKHQADVRLIEDYLS